MPARGLLRRHQGTAWLTNRLGGKGFLAQLWWTGRPPRWRPNTPVPAWCWPAPDWCWPRRAGRATRMRPGVLDRSGAPGLGSGRQYIVVDQPRGRGAGACCSRSHTPPFRPGQPDRAGAGSQRRITTAFGRAVNRPTPLTLPVSRYAPRARRIRREGLLTGRAPSRPRWKRAGFSVPSQHHWRGRRLRHRPARPRLGSDFGTPINVLVIARTIPLPVIDECRRERWAPEEEFHLVDLRPRRLTARAPELLSELSDTTRRAASAALSR